MAEGGAAWGAGAGVAGALPHPVAMMTARAAPRWRRGGGLACS